MTFNSNNIHYVSFLHSVILSSEFISSPSIFLAFLSQTLFSLAATWPLLTVYLQMSNLVFYFFLAHLLHKCDVPVAAN